MITLTFDLFKRDIPMELMGQGINTDGLVEVKTMDNKIKKMPFREFLLWFYLVKPMADFKVSINTEDIHSLQPFNNNLLQIIHTKVFYRCFNYLVDKYPEKKDSLRDTILHSIGKSIDNICNFTIIYCDEFGSTIDLIGLVETITNVDKFKEISSKLNTDITFGTDKAEQNIKLVSDEFIDALKNDPAFKDNTISAYLKTDNLNLGMLSQFFLAYGTRSDIDGSIPLHCISSGALDGVTDSIDYIVESLAAKKAMFNNKQVISNSQYINRELQLACSKFTTIHEGDCGTTVTLPICVTQANHKKLKFKHFVEKGKLKTFMNEENKKLGYVKSEDYIGKTIELRSALCCKHTDGCCEICGGILATNFDKRICLGINSAIIFWSAVSQLVLSTKHLNKSNSQMYMPDQGAKRFLKPKGNGIYWHPTVSKNTATWSIAISVDDIRPLDDLFTLDGDDMNNPKEFTKRIESVTMISSAAGNGNVLESEIPIAADDISPYLSKYALAHIKKHITHIEETEDHFIIPLNKFPMKKPFFNYIIMNDDMPIYVNKVASFLNSKNIIGRYKNLQNLVEDFLEIVYSKVHTNEFFIEIVLRSFLVENEETLRTPVITDTTDIHAVGMTPAILGKGLATKLLHESMGDFVRDFKTYTKSYPSNIFDGLIGIV